MLQCLDDEHIQANFMLISVPLVGL